MKLTKDSLHEFIREEMDTVSVVEEAISDLEEMAMDIDENLDQIESVQDNLEDVNPKVARSLGRVSDKIVDVVTDLEVVCELLDESQ